LHDGFVKVKDIPHVMNLDIQDELWMKKPLSVMGEMCDLYIYTVDQVLK